MVMNLVLYFAEISTYFLKNSVLMHFNAIFSFLEFTRFIKCVFLGMRLCYFNLLFFLFQLKFRPPCCNWMLIRVTFQYKITGMVCNHFLLLLLSVRLRVSTTNLITYLLIDVTINDFHMSFVMVMLRVVYY